MTTIFKTISPIVLFLFIFSNKAEAQCPYFVDLYSQTDVDDFAVNYPDCVAQGFVESLTINGTSITDLSALYNSISINYTLEVRNTGIIDLSGFNAQNTIHTLKITGNPFLSHISGFQNLTNIDFELNLQGNSLVNISGLSNIEGAYDIFINNTQLSNLDDLSSLKVASRQLNILSNPILTDISSLDDYVYIHDLLIVGNALLSDCCIIHQLQKSNVINGAIRIGNNINCASYANIINACPDADNDGVLDAVDNCPTGSNIDQSDIDSDGIGDGCDNCPNLANPSQTDSNNNGVGDACEDPTALPYGIINDIGDSYISGSTRGLILKSPDGTTCYRIRVNNSGGLETYQVACPQ